MNIILSGLGMNYKTSSLVNIEEDLTVKSMTNDLFRLQESLFAKTNDTRYMLLMKSAYYASLDKKILDRCILDQICISKILHGNNGTWKYDVPQLSETEVESLMKIHLKNNQDSFHLILLNQNQDELHRLISDYSILGPTRSTLYRTVEDYLRVQNLYYEEYSRLISDYNLIGEVLIQKEDAKTSSEVLENRINQLIDHYEFRS